MSPTVGEILKNKRLESNLSLETVARNTHIKIQFLNMLENDQYNEFPSRVQVRGFLRIYSDYLGISAQMLLDIWEGKIQNAIDQIEKTNIVENRELPSHEIPVPTVNDLTKTDDSSSEFIASSFDNLDNLSSQEIFSLIGSELKNRREKLGISVDDVEKFTYLRTHYVKALESGEFGNLPSLVHARGMLNNYARFLEMDLETILNKFAIALQKRRVEIAPPTGKHKIFNRQKTGKKSSWRQLLSPDLLIGSFVMILLFLFVLWGASQIISNQNTSQNLDFNSIPSSLLASSSPIINPPNLTVEPTYYPNTGAGESSSGQNPQAVNPNPELTATLPIIGDFPLQLYVVASQRAFLRVTVDNQIKFNGRVIPGGPLYTFAGSQKIELLTGNAAAIQVYFNQTNLGTLGQQGEVKSLIFTIDGVRTPTPMYKPTATITLQFTVTQQPTPTITPTIITPTSQ